MAQDARLQDIVDLLPQKAPFLFVDEILSADEHSITGAYRFKPGEFFYQGHFPGNPVTPGVILVESMAQAGLCAHTIYKFLEQGKPNEEIRGMTTLFTLADGVEFLDVVRPGERVLILGERILFRKKSMRSRVTMTREDGQPVARGVLTGTGVWA